MTAYERGRGIGVVVLETRDQAEQLSGAIAPGTEIRPGVVVRQSDVGAARTVVPAWTFSLSAMGVISALMPRSCAWPTSTANTSKES